MQSIHDKFYDIYANTSKENTSSSLYDFLRIHALKRIKEVALEYGATSFTYAQLIEQIDKTAYAFAKSGVSKGDIVTVCLPDIPAFIFTIYALSKIGAIGAIVDRDESNSALKEKLKTSKSKILVVEYGRLDDLLFVLSQTKVSTVVLVKKEMNLSLVDKIQMVLRSEVKSISIAKHLAYDVPSNVAAFMWDDFIKKMTNMYGKDNDIVVKQEEFSGRDCVLFFYSGGAEGVVKTIMASSESINAVAQIFGCLYMEFENDEDKEIKSNVQHVADRFLSGLINSTPKDFVLAKHAQFCVGNTVVLYPPYDNGTFVGALIGTKASSVFAYPSTFIQMTKSASAAKTNFDFLRKVYSSGTVFNGVDKYEFLEFLKEKNSNVLLMETYGLSEAMAACVYCTSIMGVEKTIGIPLPKVIVKIIDSETMAEKTVGQKGEICVNTPGMMLGYFEDEGGTNRVIRRHRDGRKWIHTGDIGHIDEKGFIYFDGQQKNCIEINGVHVYIKEIEDAIRTVLGVEEVCIISLPDADNGTKLVAIVVPNDHYLLDSSKLEGLKESIRVECEMMFVKQRRPADIAFRAYLPKNNFGAVDYDAIIKEEIANEQSLVKYDENATELDDIVDVN